MPPSAKEDLSRLRRHIMNTMTCGSHHAAMKQISLIFRRIDEYDDITELQARYVDACMCYLRTKIQAPNVRDGIALKIVNDAIWHIVRWKSIMKHRMVYQHAIEPQVGTLGGLPKDVLEKITQAL